MQTPNEMQIAVGCLTLWLEPGDDARAAATDRIRGLLKDPVGPGAEATVVGLLDLSMLLVLKLAKARGTEDYDLWPAAGKILRELTAPE